MTERPGRDDDANLIRARMYELREQHPHFVVYDHPTDHPDHFIARLWTSVPQVAAHDFLFGFRSLDDMRVYLSELGLVQLARNPEDDPQILETWF